MADITKKAWPEAFRAIADGQKTFDLRLADFDCKPGDTLILQEWNPETKEYTGRELRKKIGFVVKSNRLGSVAERTNRRARVSSFVVA